MNNIIANKIRFQRQKMNLSREALAEITGLSSKTIQRVEEGNEIAYESLEKIAESLNIPIDELGSKREYTDNQKKAITSKSDNLLVVAGAGAGKTKTLEGRIVHLIESGVKPSEIIAWTFTEKAANELNIRVKNLLKKNGLYTGSADMIIGTIHSSCLRLLQEHTDKYNGYTVLAPIQNVHFVNRYFEKIGVNNIRKIGSRETMQKYIETKRFINIVSIVNENPVDNNLIPNELKLAIANYKNALKTHRYFDFTTIQYALLFELKNNSDFVKRIKTNFKYMIIDVNVNEFFYHLTANLFTSNDNEFVYHF